MRLNSGYFTGKETQSTWITHRIICVYLKVRRKSKLLIHCVRLLRNHLNLITVINCYKVLFSFYTKKINKLWSIEANDQVYSKEANIKIILSLWPRSCFCLLVFCWNACDCWWCNLLVCSFKTFFHVPKKIFTQHLQSS